MQYGNTSTRPLSAVDGREQALCSTEPDLSPAVSRGLAPAMRLKFAATVSPTGHTGFGLILPGTVSPA
jgi:hypothetical protein